MCNKSPGSIALLLTLGLVHVALAAWDPNTDPSLVAWWAFNEGTGSVAEDSSGHGNDGRLMGDPQWVEGRFGGGLHLDGIDDYVEVSAPLKLNSNQVTITAWVNLDGRQSEWAGVVVNRAGSTVCGLHYGPGGQLRYNWNDVTWGWVSGLQMLEREWFFAAVVVEPAKATLYLNKQSAVNAVPHDIEEFDSTLVIGQDPLGGRYVRGIVDEVRVFNRSLSAADVKAMVPPQLKARKPSPVDGATGVMMPLVTWTPGETAVFEDIYLGTTPELTAANRVSHQSAILKMYFQMMPPLVPGQTYYWRVDAVDATGKVTTGDVWSFTMAPVNAWNPLPANGAKYQSIDVNPTWMTGQNATKHDVYFSTSQDDVANAAAGAFKGALVVTTLELPPLTLETTYYWRVDEIEAAGTKRVGDVWSFTTTIPGLGAAKRELWLNAGAGTSVNDLLADSRYPGSPTDVNEMPDFESPANIGDNYGGKLSAWLHVPAAGDYTFWVAGDDNTRLYLGADPDSAEMIAEVPGWSDARAWDSNPAQMSKPIALEAGRYYLMALWKEGAGGDSCSAAWQGPGVPTRELIAGSYLMPFEALWAYGPRPRNDANETTQMPELKWTAGVKATAHQVYFSDDEQAVADGTPGSAAYRGEQALDDTSFDPGALEFGKTYYWRVDEVSTTDADSPWTGTVWSFTTANFIVVDDFEDYVDDVEGRIFQTWIDGWGFTEPAPGNPGNGTSSTVGYTNPPFAEPTIVHGGRQAMPFDYNNTIQPYYSETDRTWTVAQNWTLNEMDTLSLWFRGNPAKLVETATGFTVTAASWDIWEDTTNGLWDQFRFVYKKLSGDGSIVVRVNSLVNTNGWAKAGVMIRESLAPGCPQAFVVVTPSNGVAFQRRPFADDVSASTAEAGIVAPRWVRLTRTGNIFKAEHSADGKTWTSVGTDAAASSATVTMGGSIYIGLCLTSHDAARTTTAEFTDITTTGSVSGQWQVADVRGPLTGNDPAQLYVAVQDSAGKVAVVNHPDLNAVLTTTWTEWQIPLSQFTSVNAKAIKKIFIGVGDRKAPKADGAGKLYFDDIRVIKPAPGQ